MTKKDYKNIGIIFILSLIVIFVTVRFSNVFGSDTDWLNQHTVFPDYLRMMFYKTGKLIPNLAMNYGGGQNIFNISYYGLLNPIIMISYLFPYIDMTIYIMISSVILVFASIYLFYKWLKSNEYNTEICFLSTVLFALSEAFIFHMHRHIMFVNYMPFLIMSLIGVDKIVTKNRKSYLIVSIFLMIMTSYYYSVCGIIVVGIYYLYRFFKFYNNVTIKFFIKKLLGFIGTVLIAVALSAILLLPTMYTLVSGRSANSSNYNLVQLLIPDIKVYSIFCGTYQIGLSMFGFLSLVYLFFSKKKEDLILACFSSLVLFIPIFRYLLNGGLYLREKCFIPFLPLVGIMIAIFLKELFDGNIKIKKVVLCFLLINIPLLIINKRMSYLYYFLPIIILMFYFIKFQNKKVFSILLVIISLSIAIIKNNEESLVSINDYKEIFNNNVSTSIKEVLNSDKDYYRFGNTHYSLKTVNKIYDSKYYTTNLYSSTYNNNYLNFVRNIFKSSVPEYNYFLVSSSYNTLFNTYMGVKYVYSEKNMGLSYNRISDNIYLNYNAFPIGYVQHKIISEEEFDKIEFPYNIEFLLKDAIIKNGNTNIDVNDVNISKTHLNFNIIDIDQENIMITKDKDATYLDVKKDSKFTIKLEEKLTNTLLFVNIFGLKRNSCSNGNTYITINGEKNLLTCSSWIYHNNNEIFHYLLSDSVIDEIEIEIGKGNYSISNIETYTLDFNEINNINKSLDNFKIKNISDNSITGEIDVTEDGYFVLSIPYDEGFKFFVNNEEVSKELVNKSFMGFPLNKGHYNIKIIYNSPLLKIGKILSLIGLLLFLIVFIIERREKND